MLKYLVVMRCKLTGGVERCNDAHYGGSGERKEKEGERERETLTELSEKVRKDKCKLPEQIENLGNH